MFNRMIIASEISPGAFHILHCLKGFRKLGATQCLLLQCLNPYGASIAVSSFLTKVIEENLQKQKEILVQHGYEVETRVVPGAMKHEINRIAKEEDFSVIVTGSAEHTMIGEAFFGGVAHELIHQATKPVLIIRVSDVAEGGSHNSMECNITDHILFATDFSKNADDAFEYVKKMVADGAKKVTLVHVQDQTHIEPHLSHRLEEFNETDTKRLQHLANELNEMGEAEIDMQLLYGSPSAEIIKLIADKKIPLVVMGSQGRGNIKELFLGSVSHNVGRHSPTSVLLIPAKRNR